MAQWEAIDADASKGQGPAPALPGAGHRRADHPRGAQPRSTGRWSSTTWPSTSRCASTSGAVNPELADRVEYFDPEVESPARLRALPRPRAAAQGPRPQGLAALGRLAHHRPHRGPDGHRRQHRQERRAPPTSRRPSTATTWRRPRRWPGSSACGTSAGSSSSTSSTWRSAENRDKVGSALRSALARDKTRTQVFDISELGLVEMTRKRVSEGLIESHVDHLRGLRGPRHRLRRPGRCRRLV